MAKDGATTPRRPGALFRFEPAVANQVARSTRVVDRLGRGSGRLDRERGEQGYQQPDRRQTAHAAPTRCGASGHVSAFQRMTRASMRLSTRKSNMTTAMMRHTTPISSDALYELWAKLNR